MHYTYSYIIYTISFFFCPPTHTPTHTLLVLIAERQRSVIVHHPPLVIHNLVRFGVGYGGDVRLHRVSYKLPGVGHFDLGGSFAQYHSFQRVEGDHVAVPRIQGDTLHCHFNFAVGEAVAVILGAAGDELLDVRSRR